MNAGEIAAPIVGLHRQFDGASEDSEGSAGGMPRADCHNRKMRLEIWDGGE